MRPLLLALTVTTLAAFPALAQGEKEEPDIKNPAAGQPAAIAAGKRLFLEGCSGCHGTSGQGGRGPNLQGDQVRESSNRRLLASIKNGVKGSEMPPSPLPDENIWQMIAFLRDLTSPAIESQVTGEAEAGGTLFYGKAGCASCHMIRGRGGYLGPDLTDAGRARTLSQLREAVLDSDARIAEGFQAVTVTTRDGVKVSGVAKDNTNYAIQILDGRGEVHRLLKQDLREVVFRKKSLMPSNYKERLSATEIENLLAFLSRQSIRSVEKKESSQ